MYAFKKHIPFPHVMLRHSLKPHQYPYSYIHLQALVNKLDGSSKDAGPNTISPQLLPPPSSSLSSSSSSAPLSNDRVSQQLQRDVSLHVGVYAPMWSAVVARHRDHVCTAATVSFICNHLPVHCHPSADSSHCGLHCRYRNGTLHSGSVSSVSSCECGKCECGHRTGGGVHVHELRQLRFRHDGYVLCMFVCMYVCMYILCGVCCCTHLQLLNALLAVSAVVPRTV